MICPLFPFCKSIVLLEAGTEILVNEPLSSSHWQLSRMDWRKLSVNGVSSRMTENVSAEDVLALNSPDHFAAGFVLEEGA